VILGSTCALADEHGDARAGVQLFVEPAAAERLIVVTPSAAARAAIVPWLSVALDWNADVVSGATHRTYGSSPDAVSGATQFSDVRNSVAARVEAKTGPFTFGAGYRFGIENDYRSHVLSASAKVEWNKKNSALEASYAHNFDSVCDLDNHGLPSLLRQPLPVSNGCFSNAPGIVSEPLSIDGLEVSFTQIFTARLIGQVVAAWEHLDGFQSNPYRRVSLDGGTILAQESHPLVRDRGALGLRGRYAFPKVRGALGLDLRLYRDTWAIQSFTVEAGWEQHLGQRFLLKLRARYYQQSGAFFYRDAGATDSYDHSGPVGAYFTGDREMAPLADLLIGARFTTLFGKLGPLTSLEGSLRIDLVDVFALTPAPPNADRTTGVVDALVGGLSIAGRF
jgi:hypothetical protein